MDRYGGKFNPEYDRFNPEIEPRSKFKVSQPIIAGDNTSTPIDKERLGKLARLAIKYDTIQDKYEKNHLENYEKCKAENIEKQRKKLEKIYEEKEKNLVPAKEINEKSKLKTHLKENYPDYYKKSKLVRDEKVQYTNDLKTHIKKDYPDLGEKLFSRKWKS